MKRSWKRGAAAVRPPPWADGACLVAGGLLFLAFSPWNLPAVAAGSLAVLFRAVLHAPPARAFRRGWLFGAGGFGVGLWWLSESFQYRSIGFAAAAALTALLAGVLALYPALFAWAGARFLWGRAARRAPASLSHPRPPAVDGDSPAPDPARAAEAGRASANRLDAASSAAPSAAFGAGVPSPARRRVAVAALWWLPAAWVLVEWLRGALFSGFTWLQLGYAGIESPLAAYAPLGGSYAVGLGLAVTAACIAAIGVAPRRALLTAAAAAALLWAGGAALVAFDGHTAWTRPAGPPLRVLVVQGNVPQGEKWADATRRAALDRHARLTARHPGADVVVWPETAVPYYAAQVRPFLHAAGEAAARAGYVLFTGLLTFDVAAGRPLNSVARIAGPEADEPLLYYHKRHLVPFSERMPFEGLLAPAARRLGLPAESFGAGAKRQPPLRAGGHEVAVSVCYEITFGAASARALGDAALLVNVSNDAWFGDTAGPHQHLQMARMRALEQGRWLVRATNTGVSALVAPDGRVAAAAPQFETIALEGAIVPRTGRTPYTRWGDRPVLGLLALMLLIGWRVRRETGRGKAPAPPPASRG